MICQQSDGSIVEIQVSPFGVGNFKMMAEC